MKRTTSSTRKALAFACAVMVSSLSAASANLIISGGNTLGLYSLTGARIQTFASDLVDARGVVVDPSGNVYVADFGASAGNGSIRKYSSSGVFLGNVMTSAYGGGASPIALTWNVSYPGLAATLRLTAPSLAPSGGGMAVFNVNATNTQLTLTANLGPGYLGLASVVKDAGERLLASGNDTANVQGYYQKFDAGTGFLGDYAPSPISGLLGGIGVKEVAGDNDLVFVSSSTANVLQRVDNAGTVTNIALGLSGPLGVTYSSQLDNVFVANAGNGTVAQFDILGNQIGTPFSVAGGASYLAYTTIPEPSTVALAGVGLLALWLGRRRLR